MARDSASIYDNPDKILKASSASMVVLNNYERSRDQLIGKMTGKWNEWYRAYRGYVEQRDDDIKSNLVIAAILAQVEAFLPRLVANRPKVEVWPRGPEDRVRAAQHRAKLDYDWDHMRMPIKTVNMVKGSLIFGTGCGLLTIIIRYWGGYPEGVSFAILLMNICVPLIDTYTQPRIFGEVKSRA